MRNQLLNHEYTVAFFGDKWWGEELIQYEIVCRLLNMFVGGGTSNFVYS